MKNPVRIMPCLIAGLEENHCIPPAAGQKSANMWVRKKDTVCVCIKKTGKLSSALSVSWIDFLNCSARANTRLVWCKGNIHGLFDTASGKNACIKKSHTMKPLRVTVAFLHV